MINEHDINDHECELYKLNKGDMFKLAEEAEDVKVPIASNEFKQHDLFKFHHVDGMYSYCTALSDGAVHHFAAWTKVRKL